VTTETERVAAELGRICRFNIGLYEAEWEIESNLPGKFYVHAGGEKPPDIPAAAEPPVRIGTVQIRHADPPFHLWLWRRKDD
jgi:hypothetical protein